MEEKEKQENLNDKDKESSSVSDSSIKKSNVSDDNDRELTQKEKKIERLNIHRSIKVENSSIEKQLKYYYVSMILTFVAVGIAALFAYPNYSNVGDLRIDREVANQELNAKSAELEELRELEDNADTNRILLAKLEEIIPTKTTEVVNFERKIQGFSLDLGIKMEDVIAQEEILINSIDNSGNQAVEDGLVSGNLDVYEIPVEFNLTGSSVASEAVGVFRNMLNLIYNSSDFIVISEMFLDLKTTASGGFGGGSTGSKMVLVLAKYQYGELPEDENAQRALLNTVPLKERPEDSVIEFIERKTDFNVETT